MGHKHSVYDSDAHFSINPITKVIKNESSKKTTLVQGDHNSERFSFDIPRFIEGHDMMNCNLVEVHLKDFNGNLYGKALKIEFVKYIREIKKFGSVDELIQQLKKDFNDIKR